MMTRLDYPSVGETLYRGRLENGLRISVVPKPGYTRCFAMFCTDYGGADRRFAVGGEFIDTPAGVAHFLEHKMFDMPDGDNALSALAANGAQPNAFTSGAMTAYYFESTENFFENLEMLLRFVQTPYFTDESVKKEQGIIGQEIRMCEDSPDYAVYDETLRSLYEHNPARESVVGTVESIAEITPQTLYNCHKIFYNPSNMCLCVVGDVDPKRVFKTAESVVTAPAGEMPRRDYGEPEPERPKRESFERAMEVSAAQLIIGVKLTPPGTGETLLRSKLTAAAAAACIFGASSPFYSRLYGEGLINTDFSYGFDCTAGTFSFMLGGETREPKRVYDEVLGEIARISREGLDAELFSRCKKAFYGSQIRALSSFYGLCSSMAEAEFGNYNCLDSFAVLESVTAEEVLDFVRTELLPERMTMTVITPAAGQDGEA